MSKISFYEIEEQYIDYLSSYAPLLFHNAKPGQQNSRKYIGVVLDINDSSYYVPLSSFKQKHSKMKDGLDFIKIKTYAVLNLNCMFPAPIETCHKIVFSQIKDLRYRSLLLAEYREIKRLREKIKKNAATLYRHKIANGESTRLAKRCNDFSALEILASAYERDNCPANEEREES